MLRNPICITSFVGTLSYSFYSFYEQKKQTEVEEELKPSLSDLFNQYKIEKIPSQKPGRFRSQFDNFILHETDPKAAPYKDIFPEENLDKVKAKRLADCRILARGDTRPPQKIFEVGGFHPQSTNPDCPPKNTQEILDILSHRTTAKGSGFVSFTSDPSVADYFGKHSSKSNELESEQLYYIYTAAGENLIHVDEKLNTEKEYLAAGGMDAKKIIAIKECSAKTGICSHLFFNKKFEEMHRDLLERVAKANLREDEICPKLGIKK